MDEVGLTRARELLARLETPLKVKQSYMAALQNLAALKLFLGGSLEAEVRSDLTRMYDEHLGRLAVLEAEWPELEEVRESVDQLSA